MRIVILDDEKLITVLLHESIMMMFPDWNVITYHNPTEALEELTEDVNLLITDHDMPEMLGSEVADRFLAVIPGIKIIMITGRHLDTVPGSVDVVVQKPFKLPDILEIMNELLSEGSP